MAKCEKREIPQPQPPVEYVLTLSHDEAMLVRSLCWNRAVRGNSSGQMAAVVAKAIEEAYS